MSRCHFAAPVILAALVGTACEDRVRSPEGNIFSPPTFVIGGQPDFAHTNVGALVTFHPFIPGNPLAPLCSGTLIDQSVVVTAGHCAFFIADFGLPAWVTFDQQFSESSPLVPVTAAIPHPDFSPSVNPNDVSGIGGDPSELGVLLLAEPVTDRPLATLPAEGLLDDLKKQKMLHSGDPFTVVGYGAIGFVDGFPAFDGRRSAEVPYKSLNGEAVTLSTPHDDAHACFGDSGGPNFLDVNGQDVLTSVTWWLGAGPLAPNVIALNCSGWHRAYRLDIPQARSFLGNYVTTLP